MKYIDKSIELKKELDSLRPLKKEDELRIMQKFRLDWNYHSNNLEGNSLTYGETKALILFGITAQGKPLKDHFEINGHDEALKWIEEIVQQDRPLTENFIRELHQLILKESYDVDAITPDGKPTKKKVNVGVYKKTPNHVKTNTGEIFRFATPEETPALMGDLINWYREKIKDDNTNPVLIASEFHYKYIRIHPFDDGNGRTARILMNFILMQFGYPPVIIKTNDKQNYFAALRQADAGILAPFIDYITINLIVSLDIMIRGAQGKDIEESDDFEKEIALLAQQMKSIAKPIDLAKNKEVILEIYDNTVSTLSEKFIKKAELFERFYMNSGFRVYVNNSSEKMTKKDAIEICKEYISIATDTIDLQFWYNSLNEIDFHNFNHISHIRFLFDYTKYQVKNSSDNIIEKTYGEFLDDNEIDQLVNYEVKKHKEILETKITEMKKSKRP